MQLAAVGVDLGGTKIAAALVDENGNMLQSLRVATDVDGGPSAVLQQIRELVSNIAHGRGVKIVGLGVGVAGQIEAGSGMVHFAPNLDWHEVPFQAQLSSACRLPVIITNDVRAITWGEWLFGAGRGCNDLICVFVGTGIGGGIVVNGKILNGCSNTAGEIGHLTVDLHGPRCTCGNYGCLEALAGGWGIARQARQAVSDNPAAGAKLLQLAGGEQDKITARMVADAHKGGDALAGNLLQEAGEALVAGMVSLVNAFNPCRLILGGGVIEGLSELVDRVRLGVRQQALAAATSKLEVHTARLGDDAGVIGAAALALQSFDK